MLTKCIMWHIHQYYEEVFCSRSANTHEELHNMFYHRGEWILTFWLFACFNDYIFILFIWSSLIESKRRINASASPVLGQKVNQTKPGLSVVVFFFNLKNYTSKNHTNTNYRYSRKWGKLKYSLSSHLQYISVYICVYVYTNIHVHTCTYTNFLNMIFLLEYIQIYEKEWFFKITIPIPK